MRQLTLLFIFAFISYIHALTDLSNGKSFDELIALYSESIHKDPSTALKYAIRAKSIIEISEKQKAETIYYISKYYNKLQNNKDALTHVELALSKSMSLKYELLLYKCFSLKGNIYNDLGQNSNALVAYSKAMEYTQG